MPSRQASSASYPSDISLGSVKLSDLSELDVGNRIPGYRTSAAFFASLKANLRLSESTSSPLPSPVPAPLGIHGNSSKNHHVSSKIRPSANVLCPPSPLLLADGNTQHNVKHLSPLHEALTPPPVANKKPQGHSRSRSNSSSNAISSGSQEAETESEPLPLLYWTTSRGDTDSALALLASTVAEQRETALRTLLTHPVNVLSFVILLVLVQKSMFCVARYKSFKSRSGIRRGDGKSGADIDDASWMAVAIVWAGIVLVFLGAAHIFTLPYSRLARRFTGFVLLGGPHAGEKISETAPPAPEPWFKAGRDEVLVAVANGPLARVDDDDVKPGNETGGKASQLPREEELIVGVLIMHWAPCVAGPKVNKRRRSCGGRSYVKAWAVKPGWRGKGLGGALLDEAARMTLKERGGDCATFAEKHAHAERVLPNFYNGAFDRRDRRARCALLRTVTARPWTNNRRR